MKYYLVVNYYLVNFDFKCDEDPCINGCAQIVNAVAHVLLRVRVFTTRLRELDANISATKAWIFIKFNVVVKYYPVSTKCARRSCKGAFALFIANACTRVINARNRDKTCTRALTTSARAILHRSA